MSLHRPLFRRGPRPPAACAPRRRGLTLIELMLTLAVLVIVVSVASPSMADFSANNQLSSTKSAFTAALALARSEAARRGAPVLLVPASGGGSGNAWGGGWEVVADEDADGQAGSSETRVRRQAALDSRVKLDGPTLVSFRATGALGAVSDQVFTLCRRDGAARGFRVTVTPSGGADVAQVSNCA